MKETELLYHHPYRVDKEHNFRHFVKKYNSFEKTVFSPYDAQIHGSFYEYLQTRDDLSETVKYKLLYLNGKYRRWEWWYKYGQNIFAFSEELLELLSHTDINEVTAKDFKLPYDIFYLSLKPLKIKVQPDRNEIIEGVYVETNTYDPNGVHNEGYFEISLQFVGEFEDYFVELCNVKDKEGFPIGGFWNMFFMFSKEEGITTMDEAIKESIEWTKNELFPKTKDGKVSDEFLDYFGSHLKLIENILKLVINCLLYLSQPNKKVDNEVKIPEKLPSNFDKKLSFAKTKKQRDKLVKKINDTGFSKINFIGNSFKNYTTHNISNGRTSTHWRRGHWRNQKFGKNLSQSKLLWILPTIVNKEKGEPTKGHLYSVDKNN